MANPKTGAPKKTEPKPQPEEKALPATRNVMTPVSAEMAALLLEDERAGQEGIGREDLAIPRLVILQALSPQCNKRDEAYVEGASAGDIFNTLSFDLFEGEEGVLIVPVSYRRAYIEWKPRTDGGGFVKDHGTDASILDRCHKDDASGKDILTNGNEIVTTAEFLCFLVDEETGVPQQVVISMTSTQLKKARRWNSMVQQLLIPRPNGAGVFNPAMFYRAYKLSTVAEGNEKGSWFGWKIEPAKNTLELNNGEEIYLAARTFSKAISAGQVKVQHVQDADITTGGGDDF